MKKLFLSLAIFTCVFALSTPVSAYRTLSQKDGLLEQTVDQTGIAKENLQTKIGSLISGALTITGTLFFGLMFYAGFLWMTAKGEEEPITKAKSTLFAAIIGLAIVISAYAITNIVTRFTENASSGSSGGSSGSSGAGSTNQNAAFQSLQAQTEMCNDRLNVCINDCTIDLDKRVEACSRTCESLAPGEEKNACSQRCQALYAVSGACADSCQTVATTCTNAANAQYEDAQGQKENVIHEASVQCEEEQLACRLECRQNFPDVLADQNSCVAQCNNYAGLCRDSIQR